MNQHNKKNIISGRHVYQDDKNRNVLYIKQHNCGYLIQEKDEKKFQLYKNRYLYVLVGFILTANFLIDIRIGIVLGLLAIGILEFQYRRKFLPSLAQITNFKPYKKVSFIGKIQQSYSKDKILLLAFLYVALGVLLILNAIQLDLSQIIFFLNASLSAGAFFLSSCYFIAAFSQKK